MATRSITRYLLTTAKQTLASSSPSPSAHSLLHLHPLLAAASNNLHYHTLAGQFSDPNPIQTITPYHGCDLEHWLVILDKPEGDLTRDELIDSYIRTLAKIVGSEEDARMRIYSVSTKHYFAFAAVVSRDLAKTLGDLPRVRLVVPDLYLDVKNKDYGREPFIDGQAAPYDPKYHDEWVQEIGKMNNRRKLYPSKKKKEMQGNPNAKNEGQDSRVRARTFQHLLSNLKRWGKKMLDKMRRYSNRKGAD